jgi:HD superfamily phosphohydrolase
MLRRATESALDAGATTPEKLRRMDDYELHATLRRCDRTAGLIARIERRDLLKRAVWAELDAVPEDLRTADHADRRELEHEIAAEAGVDVADVILDVPPAPEMTESTSRVLVNGEVRALGEQSTLVSALRTAQRDQWRLGVYAPQAVSDRVGNAAIRVLGLDVDGTLVRDVRPGVHATLDEFE